MVPLAQQPNGVFATVVSLIPPFTPLVMMMRQAMPGGVPAWQPWVGLVGVLGLHAPDHVGGSQNFPRRHSAARETAETRPIWFAGRCEADPPQFQLFRDVDL